MKFFRSKKSADAAAPVAPEAMSLRSEGVAFVVGATLRRDVELRLGPAISYPAPGWHTWTIAGMRGQAWILSAFYKNNVLIGIEHYLAKTENLPAYAPRVKGIFRLMPAGLGLGHALEPAPAFFVASAGRAGSVRSVVYQDGLEARWSGGMAVISGNDGRVERLAIYGAGVA